VGGFVFGGVYGAGGTCGSGGTDVGGCLGRYVLYMHVSKSGGVHVTGVVGEVVVGSGCIRGTRFQALHCRRLS
jgi:hypothetical protein